MGQLKYETLPFYETILHHIRLLSATMVSLLLWEFLFLTFVNI